MEVPDGEMRKPEHADKWAIEHIVGRPSYGYPPFEGAPIRYSGEIPLKFRWNSGEPLAKHAKTQETHKNI